MKKITIMKLITLSLATVIISASMLGCAKKDSSDQTNSQQSTTDTAAGVYPVKSDVTLKYWVTLQSAVAKTVTNLGETPFAKELTKKTGIKVEYIHPPINQVKENFNIMIASGDLPDIIEYQWYSFPGGPDKAINDGSITKLNEIIDKNAPNLKKFYKENPDIEKMSKTDQGNYYVFPWMMKDDSTKVSYGTIIRQDWLDELKLSMPTTIDEWYTVLKAFKEKKGAEAPLLISLDGTDFGAGEFIGGFGIKTGYYLENGKVVYGQLKPEYKEFIKTLRQWYAEGLLDKNTVTLDDKTMDAKFLSDKAGATLGYIGGTIGRYNSAMKDKDPKFNAVPAPYLSKKKGEKPMFGQKDLPVTTTGAAITQTSKNKELAARLLDYGYSEEGKLLFNFGVENESYKMVNGQPAYTDIILNNPEKLSMQEALGRYIRTSYSGPTIKDKRYVEQYYTTKQQKDAVTVWGNSEMEKYTIPRISFTPEESAEIAKITNNVNTYNKEMLAKFILGRESIENFDKYIEQLNKFGIDKVIKIYEDALARYNKR